MSPELVAGERLIRQLERSAEIAGCAIDVVCWRSRDVSASIFTCAEHRLTVAVTGAPGRAWLDTLDENSMIVPGHALVALGVGAVDDSGKRLLAEIEAQTVREA
ncbi:MAG: hypothetical protein U9R77_14030 [Pseudomonadota bacterium]|uniref:hypothetical protein n=1 Tax=Sphingobium abikonense TaxID=86193 RepID=UPI002B065768|nr:hypothetical protein [Pseudomonadota bacterium]